jgi:molybdenum cofactor cytidylyltransferase
MRYDCDMTPRTYDSVIANSACIILAAGTATRFGGNKLSAMLHGQMLGAHAAQTICAMGFSHMVAVCDPAQTALCDAYRDLGIKVVENNAPEREQSASLQLGIAAIASQAQAPKAPASILIALADMPCITPAHLHAMFAAYTAAGETRPVASHNGLAKLPPVILPPAIYQASNFSGDEGARSYLASAIEIYGDPKMLCDVDHLDDLAALNVSGPPPSF